MPKKGKASKKKGGKRERFPRADLLEAAEDCLVMATSDRIAARALAKAKKLSHRHASRYVEAALELFKLDADPDPKRRAARRAVLEAQSQRVYERCMSRGYIITKPDGTKIERIEVDSRGAMASLAFQAAMHNLLAPALTDEEPKSDEDGVLQLANKHFGGGVYIDAEAEAVPALPAGEPGAAP